MRIELPQVSPCEGCGACCRHIGLPPFEVANPDYLKPLAGLSSGPFDGREGTAEWLLADVDIFARMPAELRAAHAELLRRTAEDPTGKPCAWLDPETGKCAHYEWRPHACRVFVPGSEPCKGVRAGAQCIWKDADVDDWRNPRRRVRRKSPRVKVVGQEWERRAVAIVAAAWVSVWLLAALGFYLAALY